jgi:hypothetical protein
MRSGEAFSPFGEFFFSALAHSQQERLAQAVDQANIRSASEAELADDAAHLAAQFAIAALVVDVENGKPERARRDGNGRTVRYLFRSQRRRLLHTPDRDDSRPLQGRS